MTLLTENDIPSVCTVYSKTSYFSLESFYRLFSRMMVCVNNLVDVIVYTYLQS